MTNLCDVTETMARKLEILLGFTGLGLALWWAAAPEHRAGAGIGLVGTGSFHFPASRPAYGDESTRFDSSIPLDEIGGTLYVNDKSKGSAWLLHLETATSVVVETPFPGGNHESTLNSDGSLAAVPHYESALFHGVVDPNATIGEGNGTAGSEVSIVDVRAGTAQVLPAVDANPFGAPRPHNALWTPDGRLAVTAQLANSVVIWDLTTGAATPVELPGCHTPHLLRQIPNSSLVVATCRFTNPGDDGKKAALAVFDLATLETRALDAPLGAEGVTVTDTGDVWVGGKAEVAIFGFPAGSTRTISSLARLATKNVLGPLRLAYDKVTNSVGVVSLPSTDSDVLAKLPKSQPNFFVFDATGDRALRRNVSLYTAERGRVNSEGLACFVSRSGRSFFVTGGFNSQVVVLVDPVTVSIVTTLYMPRCTTPRGHAAEPTSLPSSSDAARRKLVGANNWSGGYCPATLRNPEDRRWAVLDGFNWSPVTPNWADAPTSGTTGRYTAGLFYFIVVVWTFTRQ